MSAEDLNRAARKPALRRAGKAPHPVPDGVPLRGRIVKIMFGQGHGFIRLPSAREVFFHRADVREGTGFNDLRVGDPVLFELLDDPVSGARALRVQPARRRR